MAAFPLLLMLARAELKITQIAQIVQLLQLLNLIRAYDDAFYKITPILMSNNVKNDSSKESPIAGPFSR